MSQCVPSWDLDNTNPSRLNIQTHSNSANSFPLDVPSLDYEQVAELTYKNGQLIMHGLAASRLPAPAKPPPAAYSAWDKPRAGGTLESLVNQATSHHPNNIIAGVNELAPWFDHHRAASSSAATATDALVPCSNGINLTNNSITKLTQSQENKENSPHVLGCSARVGSCSSSCRCGASESATRGRGHAPVDRGYLEPTSTSQWSPENTSSGGEYTRTSAEDLDSVGHSRSQAIGTGGDRKRKAVGRSSSKSRAAAIHNQSERKRRDKINQRMKTLQKMVPNSSKTDKASMLDEVIEYLKQLQAQVHMMSRMSMASPMMLPLAMQQQLQMSMMAPMGMMPPVIPAAGGFVPVPSWDMHGNDRAVMPDLMSAYLACQSQPNPMAIDAYNRMALFQQQFQHPHPPGSKN